MWDRVRRVLLARLDVGGLNHPLDAVRLHLLQREQRVQVYEP